MANSDNSGGGWGNNNNNNDSNGNGNNNKNDKYYDVNEIDDGDCHTNDDNNNITETSLPQNSTG